MLRYGFNPETDCSFVDKDTLNTSNVQLTIESKPPTTLPGVKISVNLGWVDELLYIDLFVDLFDEEIDESYSEVVPLSKVSGALPPKLGKWVGSVLSKELTH